MHQTFGLRLDNFYPVLCQIPDDSVVGIFRINNQPDFHTSFHRVDQSVSASGIRKVIDSNVNVILGIFKSIKNQILNSRIVIFTKWIIKNNFNGFFGKNFDRYGKKSQANKDSEGKEFFVFCHELFSFMDCIEKP